MSSEKAPQSPFRLTCWKPAVSSLQWNMNSWKSALRITIPHAWNLYIFKCWFIFHTTNFLGAENIPTTGEIWATHLVWPPPPSSGNTVRSRDPQTPPSGSRQSSEERQWGELHKDELLTRGTPPPLYLRSTTPHVFGNRAALFALPWAHGSGWPLPAKKQTEHAEALPAAGWGLDTPGRPGLSVLPGWRTWVLFPKKED